MKYKTNIIDQYMRKLTIDSDVAKSKKFTDVNYRGMTKACPNVRIPLNLPLYRMANARTIIDQAEFIKNNNKGADFFKKGEDNIEAQTAQHKILFKKSEDNKGNIYKELETVKKQTEPLLLTAYGVVVNGNRRLSAMRELYTEDPALYPTFSHIDAVILPETATEIEIELLESELQLRPETKLAYDWIPRRLKLRHQRRDLGISIEDLKKSWRSNEQDINTELAQLDLVDEYLDFIGESGNYRLVDKSEQIFKELEKEVRHKLPQVAEYSRKVAFSLIIAGDELEGRLYNYTNAFGKDLDEVLTQFAQEKNVELTSVQTPIDEKLLDDEDDPLADLGEKIVNVYEPLDVLFQGDTENKETGKHIAGIYDSIKREKKQEDKKRVGLKRIREANTNLHSINLVEIDPNTFTDILAQLTSIVNRANEIKTEIEKKLSAKNLVK